MEEIVKSQGFNSLKEFNHLVSNIQLNSAAEITNFKNWKNNDRTKKGLLLIMIKEGVFFIAERLIQGRTYHKCIRIKKSDNGVDTIYDGWYIDEKNIMIEPKHIVSVVFN